MKNTNTSADFFISENMERKGVTKSDVENILVAIFQSSYDGIYV